jgi:hypothetical protein
MISDPALEAGAGARPVGVEEGGQRVAGCHLGLDVVITAANQGLQVASDLGEGLEVAQAVAVGTKEVGQSVAAARIGLGPRGAPARPGGIEGVGLDRHHCVALSQQPLHCQAAGPLDGDRQPSRFA